MMNAPRRIPGLLAALGSMVLTVGLLAQPAPAAAGVATVTVSVSAVGFVPTGIEIYDVSDATPTPTYNKWCMAASSCSLAVPANTPMAIKVVSPVTFSLACPAGTNTDGPGLISGSWYGWCGSSSAIEPMADVTIVATGTAPTPPPTPTPASTGPWKATISGAGIHGVASLTVPAHGSATTVFTLSHLKKGVTVTARIVAGAACNASAAVITRLPGYTTTSRGTWRQKWVFGPAGLVKLRSAIRHGTPLWFSVHVGRSHTCARFVPVK